MALFHNARITFASTRSLLMPTPLLARRSMVAISSSRTSTSHNKTSPRLREKYPRNYQSKDASANEQNSALPHSSPSVPPRLTLQIERRRRIRHHVNSMQSFFHIPITLPNWETVFENSSKPLHLDIGCGKGLYLYNMARQQTDWNFLGLEIRQPLVQAAQEIQSESGRRNLHYMFANVNAHFKSIAESLPKGVIRRVTMMYPDPWHKSKHLKRRMLQPQLINEIAQAIEPGVEFLIETDVAPVADDMAQLMRASGWFEELPVHTTPGFATLDECTEQKRSNLLQRGASSYRKIWRRLMMRRESPNTPSSRDSIDVRK